MTTNPDETVLKVGDRVIVKTCEYAKRTGTIGFVGRIQELGTTFGIRVAWVNFGTFSTDIFRTEELELLP